MDWFILAHIFSTILSLIQISRLSDQDKDLEVIILRHQLVVMTRLHAKSVKPNRAEKMTLAVLTKKLRQSKNQPTNQLRRIIRIGQPETVLRWQRELVRRKWTVVCKNPIQMKFPRVQSEIVRQRKIPVESLKSPIWSMHFHGLVPGGTNIFHTHLAYSNWPNG